MTHGRALAYSAQCLALLGREVGEAEEMVGVASRLLVTTPDVAELPMALALIRRHQGDLAGAAALYARVIELTEHAGGQIWLAALSWAHLATIELERGRPDAARAYCATLLANAPRLGEASELPYAAVIDAIAQANLGEPTELEPPLARLRAADAPRLLAAALTYAAEAELAAGATAGARRYATEAIAVATMAERESEGVVARAVLARLDPAERPALLAVDPTLLDARARAALAAV